jgi:hypothetical protein
MEVLREILQSQPTQDCLYIYLQACLLACLLTEHHQYILSLFMQGMPWTRLGNQHWAVIREWRHTLEDYHGGAYDPTVIMGQCLQPMGYHGNAYNPSGYHGNAYNP